MRKFARHAGAVRTASVPHLHPFAWFGSHVTHVTQRLPAVQITKAKPVKCPPPQLLDCGGYSHVILVEDDLLFAPDFFSYFRATHQLLNKVAAGLFFFSTVVWTKTDHVWLSSPAHPICTWLCLTASFAASALERYASDLISPSCCIHPQDESLWCVSAWNDHGQKGMVKDATRVERTDIFPGYGWMIGGDMWLEFEQRGWCELHCARTSGCRSGLAPQCSLD